jgi:hypothetical protein
MLGEGEWDFQIYDGGHPAGYTRTPKSEDRPRPQSGLRGESACFLRSSRRLGAIIGKEGWRVSAGCVIAQPHLFGGPMRLFLATAVLFVSVATHAHYETVGADVIRGQFALSHLDYDIRKDEVIRQTRSLKNAIFYKMAIRAALTNILDSGISRDVLNQYESKFRLEFLETTAPQGETVQANWIFTLKLKGESKVYWVIVDRLGSTPTRMYSTEN